MIFGGEDTAVNEDEIIWMKGWQQNLEETHEPELDRLRKEKNIWRLLRVFEAVQRPVSVGLINLLKKREGSVARRNLSWLLSARPMRFWRTCRCAARLALIWPRPRWPGMTWVRPIGS